MTQFLRRPPGTYHNFCKEGYHLSPLSQRGAEEGRKTMISDSLYFQKVLFKKKEEERLLQPFPKPLVTTPDGKQSAEEEEWGQVPRRNIQAASSATDKTPKKNWLGGTPRQGPECSPKRNSCSKGHIGIKPGVQDPEAFAKWKGHRPAVPDLKRQVMWGLSEHPLPDIGPMEALGFWHYHQCQKLQERMLKFPSCPIEQRLKNKKYFRKIK